MKLRWVEIEGMKYVEDYEDDHDHCAKCVFSEEPLDDYCGRVACESIVFIPLEPQHIPNLRKVGRKL